LRPELTGMQSPWPALEFELLQLRWWSEEHPDADKLDTTALEAIIRAEEVDRIELLDLKHQFLRESADALKQPTALKELVSWALNYRVTEAEAVDLVGRFRKALLTSRPT